MASKCQKFVPNMFNKAKCQTCFAAKDAHSAAALENSKATRKVSKCGYLFVSPGYDFNNPLDRTRRWQRRFFRLYDDGEFSYCVDENPDTVPQGNVDMNKCTDVLDAEGTTTHPFSLSIITPDKTLFIKGNSKEEIQWWQDVLAEFPKALKNIIPKRKQPFLIFSNKENSGDTNDNNLGSFTKSHTDGPAYATFKGVRSLKHKYDTSYQDGLRKSSSLHDLSSENQDMQRSLESSRYLSRSGDRLDSLTRESIYSLARNTPLTVHKSAVSFSPVSPNSNTPLLITKNVASSHSSISSASSAASDRQSANSNRNTNGRLPRERSSSLKDFSTQFSIIPDSQDKYNQSNLNTDITDSNQTDELKIAQNSEVQTSGRSKKLNSSGTPSVKRKFVSFKSEDLAYLKKGWLIKQAATDKESHKHWFVLAGNSLRYYEDAKAEESNTLEGRIDLSTCFEVSEVSTHRNYGFKIKSWTAEYGTGNGEYILAAMTPGIRSNWMKVLRLCMELHSSLPKWKLTAGATSSITNSLPRNAVDDLDFKSPSPPSKTTVTRGEGGETAFQIVGHRDPYRKEILRPARRHHSDVNPSNVSKAFSVKEFTPSLEPSKGSTLSLETSSLSFSSSLKSSVGNKAENSGIGAKAVGYCTTSLESTPKLTKAGNTRDGLFKLKTVESTASSGAAAHGTENLLKRNITSESNKEEVKRDLLRHAKSPSARVKEKTRASKSALGPSSVSSVEEIFSYNFSPSDVGSAMSDTTNDTSYNDSHMSEEDIEEYPAQEDTDNDEVGSATASDVIADGALVEILETEVESLKDRLELTQTELDKIHKDNLDLKSRLHKESLQSVDSGFSSRWGAQTSTSDSQWLVTSGNNELLKRQLKDAKDTIQRQKMDIEGLKGKLEMSVSKLKGTEKALSEALRDCKQEKDKIVKLSSEWNRRMRSMENQSKDSIHKLEHSRETLQVKERECRRLEAELKSNLQKSREQEREILKLKAVEHDYNQLKEKLDDREHELANLRSEIKEKEHVIKKIKEDSERQLDQLDRAFSHEREDYESHLEQLKLELYSAHDRQTSMTDNMTNNIADILKEKDDIIAQLEEKMIEADKKLVDLSDELNAEMGENADLAHSIDMLKKEKVKLTSAIEELQIQHMAMRTKVSGLESDNTSLRRQLEELRHENTQLHDGFTGSSSERQTAPDGDREKNELKLTVIELNRRIQDLQTKMEDVHLMADAKYERGNSANSYSSDHQQDLLHNVLVVDSQLKEINTMMHHLRQSFDTYIESLPERERSKLIRLGNLIEDVGHKCQDIQEVLREGGSESFHPDYTHVITVNNQSNGKIIMEEYLNLKGKFDQVVAELRKIKLNTKEHCKFCDSLKQEGLKLKEQIAQLESGSRNQITLMSSRIDALTNKLGHEHFKDNADAIDVDKHLKLLEEHISCLEKESDTIELKKTNDASLGLITLADTLNKIHTLNASAISQAEQISHISSYSSQEASVLTKLKNVDKRLETVASKLSLPVKSILSSNQDSSQESAVSCEGINDCLSVIRERVQEIGEQLDSLDEADEDSDSENEGDQTTVEDIREKLAQLTEYIEEHSKMTSSDWALQRLLSLQKASLLPKIESDEVTSYEDDLTERKLKLFSDKLALEAMILSEMAHILQNKDFLASGDAVNREIDSLNNQLIKLHLLLDNETKTMHFDDNLSDVLLNYTELIAEKILINGQLCINLFDQKDQPSKDLTDSDKPNVVQPVILATEALLRGQIDSFIGTNLEKTLDNILEVPTHIITHATVQGELTYALKQLKSNLQHHPEALQPGTGSHQFMLGQLLLRQRRVLESFNSYFKQIVHSLAVIIFKESEEMTIVQGPESVLEAMCSEISTIIERHIQLFKEKYRTAQNSHCAYKYDLIVNELRSIRETTLSEIKFKHDMYSKNPTEIRDSSLDIPVQSLDSTITNFGEILSQKAIMYGTSTFLAELIKMGSSVLSGLELEPADNAEEITILEKNMFGFINTLCQCLEKESLSKFLLSKKMIGGISSDGEYSVESLQSTALKSPDLIGYSGLADVIIREAVHSAQLTFTLFKQKLAFEQELGRTKFTRSTFSRAEQESRDSDEGLDMQADVQAILASVQEILENKHEDELEVLNVLIAMVGQIKLTGTQDEQLKQLEQKLHHELEVAKERHETDTEVYKQEASKLDKTLEDLQSDRDHYEERAAQLEDELNTLKLQHEEEKERVKQDILTAVHAIRNNEEKSEMNLVGKAARLEKELALQKVSIKKFLTSLKKDLAVKEKQVLIQAIDTELKHISFSPVEVEQDDYQPPLPSQPPPDIPDGIMHTLEQPVAQITSTMPINLASHEHAFEQLKREKEEALAEEIRNTKAAIDAVRSAYEDELTKERDKFKEALRTMYTEDFVNEIRLRHREEMDKISEELRILSLHYNSQGEDLKLNDLKLKQIKADYEGHVSQLINSNKHLEDLLNNEIESLKEFIKNKPPSLTTGSVTMEEELYDAKIMVRVKDTELQKLRSQVKLLENNNHTVTQEHRQTMTSYLEMCKQLSLQKQEYEKEIEQLNQKLYKASGSLGHRANIKRTPSFHQRARSPSPSSATATRKESDHSSRDSHRRKHINNIDLRRSKSSPSLPFVFNSKGGTPKQAIPGSAVKARRRSRSPK